YSVEKSSRVARCSWPCVNGHLSLRERITRDARLLRVARQMFQSHPDLFPFASSFDLTRIEEPGYTNEVLAWLEGTFKDGAVMTKIWKEVGMEERRKGRLMGD